MPELAEKQTNREHYLADLEKVRTADGPAWVRELRESAATRFVETAFPHYKEEAWRFTNVTPIVKTPFRSIVGEPAGRVNPDDLAPTFFDAPDWPQLVFVDGIYSKELSRLPKTDSGVRVSSLAEALVEHEDRVKPHLDQVVDHTSAFVPLNTAFLQDGAFIYVAPNAIVETPVHFIFVSTGADTVAAYPRNLFIAGTSSQSKIIESYVAAPNSGAYLNDVVTEIVVEDNAHVFRYKVVEEGDAAYHLECAKVSLGRDSRLTSFAITLTGQIVRNELQVRLGGEGGHAVMNGLYLNDRDRLIDNALQVEHAAANCYSRMGYKGVLDDTSSSVFTGKVLVPTGSQKTDSNQLNNNLLLSDKATIDTKPQLEIFADDVKCTHGATIGGFPRELVFYFQTRGMTADMANAILTYGFASEVVDEIDVPELNERLATYVFDKYSPK